MSLWDEDDVLDEEQKKAERQAEAREFFDTDGGPDLSPFSWETMRQQSRDGLHPGVEIMPYITYIPELLNPPKRPETPKFMKFTKEQERKKEEARAAKKAGEDEDSDDDESRPSRVRPTGGRMFGIGGKSALPRKKRAFDKNGAAVYIQKLYRTRMAQRRVRKLVCKTWCKKSDTTPGIFYYQNVHTGETRWVPPALMRRLFPGVKW